MPQILEIPLSPVVKKYFCHESNLGPHPRAEKRHWLGRQICSIVSFHPLDKPDLPVEYTTKNMDKLEIMEVEITFPLKTNLLDLHHLLAIGAAMEAVFELSVLSYMRGRLEFSLNYSSAIQSFFTRYDLYSTDYDVDFFRRFMHKKYGTQIQKEYDAVLAAKEAEIERAKSY